jgi:hypothetical protein
VDLAVPNDLDDLLLDGLPDPLELLRPALESKARDRASGLLDPCGGAAVGGDAEPVGAFQLH